MRFGDRATKARTGIRAFLFVIKSWLSTRRLITIPSKLFVVSLFLSTFAIAQSAPTCDKPYRLGHFVQLGTEDLRMDRTRAATKKEQKEWSNKQAQAQNECNTFASQHPNLAVSKEFSFTVKGFVTVRERCESFCGTDKELEQLYQKEAGKP